MATRNSLKAALGREGGASLVEYALTVALIAVVAIVSVTEMGTSASEVFDRYVLQMGSGTSVAKAPPSGGATSGGEGSGGGAIPGPR